MNRVERLGQAMKRATLDTLSGIFVLIALVFLSSYSIKLGKMDLLGDGFYQIYAEFDTVAGLKNRAAVEISGVHVGMVEGITLDPESEQARVCLEIKNGIKLQEDVVASIRAQGLIGNKFISISPGGSSRIIPPGGKIENTESSVDFEQLISQLVQGKV